MGERLSRLSWDPGERRVREGAPQHHHAHKDGKGHRKFMERGNMRGNPGPWL